MLWQSLPGTDVLRSGAALPSALPPELQHLRPGLPAGVRRP
jgi:hypothetical protein